MNEIILKLRDKDDKAAYEYSKLLGAESAQSDKYLPMIPQFADMLEDKSSYVRAGGFILICNQARWAKDGQIADVFDRMSDGTLWEGQIALYFRWTCLPDCAVPELEADYRRNNRRLS